jgi:glycosyltransferase involved in cell wall biosynthesis
MKPRPKIAIISDAVYPFNKGGKEKRIHDITTRLAAQGSEVTIYCMQWWKGGKVIIKDNVTFHAISPYYPLYAGTRRSIKEAVLFALHCLKLMDKSFDVIDVDHMPHLVLFTTKIVCMLKRKRMIVTWHEVWGKKYWENYLGAMGGIIASLVEAVSVRLPDVIISISPHTTDALRGTLGAKKDIVTIPIGVDSERIRDIAPSNHVSDIIFVGRLLSHKNIDVLLRAVAIIKKLKPSIFAYIVGDGPEREHLEDLATELDIQKNVRFLGIVEQQDDLYALMKASRVFVLPSTREGFGVVAIEANACGLPFITTDHAQNAAKELLVNDENGVAVPLGEAQFANAIVQLLHKRKDVAAYRAHAEKYSWDNIVSELKQVYAI